MSSHAPQTSLYSFWDNRFPRKDNLESTPRLYDTLVQQALAEWGTPVPSLALDTSTLWNTYSLVRIAMVYRGRTVPLVWKVLDHASSSVACDVNNSKVPGLFMVRRENPLQSRRSYRDVHLKPGF